MRARLTACLTILLLALVLHLPGASAQEVEWSALTDEEISRLEQTGERVIAPEYPVPEHVVRLLSVAKAELGYVEQRGNVTKYGVWAGEPAAEWCAEYLCWCVDQTDQQYGMTLLNNAYPKYSGTNIGLRWFLKKGRYIARKGTVPEYGSQWMKGSETQIEKNSYVPQPGDWMFFSTLASGDTTHVAMVEFCTRTQDGAVHVHVLEGNRPDRVQQATYSLADETILGYGTVYDLADIVLRQGQDGEKVRALQMMLFITGYLEESYIDGHYGQRTADAVRAYQTAAGKTPTGIANHHTQLDLQKYVREYCLAHPELWAVEEDE